MKRTFHLPESQGGVGCSEQLLIVHWNLRSVWSRHISPESPKSSWWRNPDNDGIASVHVRMKECPVTVCSRQDESSVQSLSAHVRTSVQSLSAHVRMEECPVTVCSRQDECSVTVCSRQDGGMSSHCLLTSGWINVQWESADVRMDECPATVCSRQDGWAFSHCLLTSGWRNVGSRQDGDIFSQSLPTSGWMSVQSQCAYVRMKECPVTVCPNQDRWVSSHSLLTSGCVSVCLYISLSFSLSLSLSLSLFQKGGVVSSIPKIGVLLYEIPVLPF